MPYPTNTQFSSTNIAVFSMPYHGSSKPLPYSAFRRHISDCFRRAEHHPLIKGWSNSYSASFSSRRSKRRLTMKYSTRRRRWAWTDDKTDWSGSWRRACDPRPRACSRCCPSSRAHRSGEKAPLESSRRGYSACLTDRRTLQSGRAYPPCDHRRSRRERHTAQDVSARHIRQGQRRHPRPVSLEPRSLWRAPYALPREVQMPDFPQPKKADWGCHNEAAGIRLSPRAVVFSIASNHLLSASITQKRSNYKLFRDVASVVPYGFKLRI